MFHMSGKTLPTNREGKTDWNWASYFALKKQKLQEQYDETNTQDNTDLDEQSRTLFNSIGIFVNGYTNPTAIELKALMHRHGGRFYDYPNEGITHYIANNLAYSKAVAFRNKLVVRPEWIVNCIKEKRILSTDSYLVVTFKTNQNKLNFTPKQSPSLAKNFSSVRSKTKTSIITKNNRPSDPIRQPRTLSKPANHSEYKCFKQKLSDFELPDYVNQTNRPKSELELEKIKHFLSDWIFWTSRNHSNVVDSDELELFKGYLLYILNTKKQLESLSTILKVLKRLIQTNGSFEWIEVYKELCMLIQTDFYVEFDSSIKLD